MANAIISGNFLAHRSAYRNSVSRVLLLVGLATLLTISCVLAIKSDSSSEPIHSAGLSDLGEASGKSAMKHRVIIVGGGLAGLASAVSAHEAILSSGLDAEIVIMEKTPKLGGNSMKASSGMNALTVDSGDASELYKADTLASGGGLSKEELVSTLVANSAEAVDALEKLGVNLSKITWMGGHSVARTHSNPVGGNVGFSIMKVMIDHVNTLPGVRVLTNTKLEKLVVDGGRVKGVVATQTDGDKSEELSLDCDAVILACGGFGANKELISSKSSAAASLATTNGPWATGDALDIASNIGASLIHLDQVQIHPTGLVDPKDPDAGTKFLAPEKLRGVGGILLTAEGHRFVDELSTRDVVSGAMLEQPNKRAHLVMSNKAVEDFGRSAIDFYCSKGFFVKADNVADLADKLSVGAAALQAELEQYNAVAESSGSVADTFGKKVFPSTFPTNEPMYAASVAPVVHYTMGGIEINEKAQVLSEENKKPISGLYAAGEASGGLHGANRLGGNSLIECAVFGRIAGREAVGYANDAAAI